MQEPQSIEFHPYAEVNVDQASILPTAVESPHSVSSVSSSTHAETMPDYSVPNCNLRTFFPLSMGQEHLHRVGWREIATEINASLGRMCLQFEVANRDWHSEISQLEAQLASQTARAERAEMLVSTLEAAETAEKALAALLKAYEMLPVQAKAEEEEIESDAQEDYRPTQPEGVWSFLPKFLRVKPSTVSIL
ncbi:hypothetical protein VNI00_002520 [Paramarasmius palmivorus]|uniref:Uncharacterized protein n=1 Tax=Paramarasmius palmivorus TaxID=297713 RepID=A0AAW0DZM0_9AGAR